MRKLTVLLMCMTAASLWWLEAFAQDPGGTAIYFHSRQFKIPFKNDQKNLNVTQIRLYVSNDQGRNWQFTATAAPEEQHFRFNTPQDGFYWFAVQTVDKDGKLFPPSVDMIKPNLKVVVDTVPPTVQVQALPPRNGEVGVSWKVNDENLDPSLPDAVQLQYRLAGGVSWNNLAIPPNANHHFWNPRTNAPIEVRILARDRAGNTGEDKTSVSLAGGANQGFNNPFDNRPEQQQQIPKEVDRKFVNSKQISLQYDLKDVGPSGVSLVELWYTVYNGRAWNKLTEYPIDLKNGGEGGSKKLSFEIQEEGVYGITLVAKSGVGLGERPPQVGDRPQFWLEVDTTKPAVQLLGVFVGTGPEEGRLSITWGAHDKNLGPTPIRLSYSEQKDGAWQTIAEKLGNSGRHIWTMPKAQIPYQFYVRVEATDLAGNVGEAITPDRVKVDLSTPKAKIITIEPGSK